MWRDISMQLSANTTVWPGDTPFTLTPENRIDDAALFNLSRISMSAHCGTHMDAPWHIVEGGKTLHELDSELFFGEAGLVECLGVGHITTEALGASPLPRRLLLKTRNSEFPATGSFYDEFAALTEAAATRLVAEGVRLVGIDYLSIAPADAPVPVHRILLENEVLIVEGLRLDGLPGGRYEFTVLPLAIVGADGAPCRAFLRPVLR